MNRDRLLIRRAMAIKKIVETLGIDQSQLPKAIDKAHAELFLLEAIADNLSEGESKAELLESISAIDGIGTATVQKIGEAWGIDNG